MTPQPSMKPSAFATLIMACVWLRWFAGIAENFGLPELSEYAAMFMLAVLGSLHLLQPRMSRNSAIFLLGITAWIFTGMLSTLINPTANTTVSITLFGLLALYGLFANLSCAYLTDAGAIKTLRRFVVAFVFIGAMLSVMQVYTGTGFVEHGKSTIQRAIGSGVHPVSFSIQMIAALVALEVLRAKSGRSFTIFHQFLILIGLLAIYLTFARTAWVMVFVVLGFTFLRVGRPRYKVLGFILTVPIMAVVFGSDRFSDLASLPTFLANFSFENIAFDYRYIDNSISWRIVNWGFGFQQAMEQPWLGFGPGQSAIASYFNLEMHNIFLETFFEGGVFGLIALLLVVAGLISLHRKLPANSGVDRYCKSLTDGFGFALLLAVTFSTSFVDQLMSFIIYFLLLCVSAQKASTVSQSQAVSPEYSQHKAQGFQPTHP